MIWSGYMIQHNLSIPNNQSSTGQRNQGNIPVERKGAADEIWHDCGNVTCSVAPPRPHCAWPQSSPRCAKTLRCTHGFVPPGVLRDLLPYWLWRWDQGVPYSLGSVGGGEGAEGECVWVWYRGWKIFYCCCCCFCSAGRDELRISLCYNSSKSLKRT